MSLRRPWVRLSIFCPHGFSRSVWSAKFLLALFFVATGMLTACDGKPQPSATPERTSTEAPTPTATVGPTATSTPEVTVDPTATSTPEATVDPTTTSKPTAVVPPVSDEPGSVTEDPTPPAATPLEALVRGNSAFAMDLYAALAAEQGNLFFSPYSISLALAMTYAGAMGDTERQMAEVLHFPPQDVVHDSFSSLNAGLAARAEVQESPTLELLGMDAGESTFRLNIANSVWGQQGHPFLQPFLDTLAESYDAGVRPTDFVTSPDEAREIINDWVAERTEGKIENLIPQNTINAFPRMILVNAIYFNARWLDEFDKSSTSMEPFHLLDGARIDVPMMNVEEYFLYSDGDGYQAVNLPYHGELSMVAIVPDLGRFREFERSLDAERLSRIIGHLRGYRVTLQMPKFKLESAFDLGKTLALMGIPNALNSTAADFSGMDGKSCVARDPQCLYISGVFHKAFVAVDEEGTEAAAATGIVAKAVSIPATPTVSLTIDRPFIFLIRDDVTGAILFQGRVEVPYDVSPTEPTSTAEVSPTVPPGTADDKLILTAEWPESGEYGSLAPNFDFTVVKGDSIPAGPMTLESLRGKPLVIQFWAQSCPRCVPQMETLGTFYEEYQDRVNVVAVDLGDIGDWGDWNLVNILERSRVPVASTEDQSIIEKYHVYDIPSTVFVDADGWIFMNWRGDTDLPVLLYYTERMLTRDRASLSPPVDYCRQRPTDGVWIAPAGDEWTWREYTQRLHAVLDRLRERFERNPHANGWGLGVVPVGQGSWDVPDKNGDGQSDINSIVVTVTEMADQATLPAEVRIPHCAYGIPVQTWMIGPITAASG